MSRRLTVAFIVLAVAAAMLFVRLGFWQLSRLAERRRFNALVISRLDSAVVPLARLPRDTALASFRRVTLEGQWDETHELVLMGRSHEGSPGVHLVTPLRIPGNDTAVLVNRGWAYAPDAGTVDQGRWRDPLDSAQVLGFVTALPSRLPGATSAGALPRVRWIDRSEVERWAGYPVFPFVVVRTVDSLAVAARKDSTPAPLPTPALDEGPHQSYAIQWFSFAAIALIGVPVFLLARAGDAERARRVPAAPRMPGRGE